MEKIITTSEMGEAKPYLVDVAVLCLFFNRPEQFRQVFDVVRKARPSKLYLYQDGPRNDRDMPGILACRNIVSYIDWQCEVHQLYQENNVGCDPSEYISQKWMFSHEEKGIVLEDDDVPSLSFFSFCKVLLDKYEHDERVSMISGINYEIETQNCPYDYFFTSDVAIWGWASWKRVVDQWDEKYAFLNKEYELELIKQNIKARNLRKSLVRMTQKHSNTGKAYYESILIMNQLLNSGLAIVPKKNMIHNIGMVGDSTHFNGSLKTLTKAEYRMSTMPVFDMDTDDIKHPLYVIEDYSYNQRVNVFLSRNSFFMKSIDRLFVAIKRIRYGKFAALKKSIVKRL